MWQGCRSNAAETGDREELKMKVRCKKRTTALIVVLSLFCLGGPAWAQQSKGKAQKAKKGKCVKALQVIGEVSSFSPSKKNPQHIGIDYAIDTAKGAVSTVMLSLDENLKLVHKGSLGEINIGDTVYVAFEVITETTEEGEQRTKRVAKEIRFVRAANQAARQRHGLVQNPIEKFIADKVKEAQERGLLSLNPSQEEIDRLAEGKMEEWIRSGELPPEGAILRAPHRVLRSE